MAKYEILISGTDEPIIIEASSETDALNAVKVQLGTDDISGDILEII